jgi:hypothetical protein
MRSKELIHKFKPASICSINIYLQEDLFFQVQIVTADVVWNCMEFFKMGTYALCNHRRYLGGIGGIGSGCKGLQSKSSKLLNASVF